MSFIELWRLTKSGAVQILVRPPRLARSHHRHSGVRPLSAYTGSSDDISCDLSAGSGVKLLRGRSKPVRNDDHFSPLFCS